MSKLIVKYKNHEYTAESSLSILGVNKIKLETFMSIEATNILKHCPEFKTGDAYSAVLIDNASKQRAFINSSQEPIGKRFLIIDDI